VKATECPFSFTPTRLPTLFSTSAPDLLQKMHDLLEVEICADRMSEKSVQRLAMMVVH
jgi:hypothetical protein